MRWGLTLFRVAGGLLVAAVGLLATTAASDWSGGYWLVGCVLCVMLLLVWLGVRSQG